jgi:hypothetical protein
MSIRSVEAFEIEQEPSASERVIPPSGTLSVEFCGCREGRLSQVRPTWSLQDVKMLIVAEERSSGNLANLNAETSNEAVTSTLASSPFPRTSSAEPLRPRKLEPDLCAGSSD